MFFDCGHKSESRPQKEERRKKVKLTWDIQRCWTLCSLEERNGWKPPHFFHQSLLISFFFFHNNVKMASSQYLTQHPASLSLDLTKMKVCVSPQVGVAMETTIIQCSRQWLLNKRELSDGIKEQAWFLFPCNMCWQHQQPSRGMGEWVAYITSSTSRPRTQSCSPPITVAQSVLWVRLVNNGKQSPMQCVTADKIP